MRVFVIVLMVSVVAGSAWALDYGKLTDGEKTYVNAMLRIGRMTKSDNHILLRSNEEISASASEWARNRAASIDKKIAELQAERSALGVKDE